MKELLLKPLQRSGDLPTLLPAKTVRIRLVASLEEMKKSGINFGSLRKGVLVGGNILLESRN
jgi:hypothetical protein